MKNKSVKNEEPKPVKFTSCSEEGHLLQSAAREITELRAENRILRARTRMFDEMFSLLNNNRDQAKMCVGGYSSDIVESLNKLIE